MSEGIVLTAVGQEYISQCRDRITYDQREKQKLAMTINGQGLVVGSVSRQDLFWAVSRHGLFGT